MARRKNATYTLHDTYGHPTTGMTEDRRMIEQFYDDLGIAFPAGDIPIPPLSALHLAHGPDSTREQGVVFLKYAYTGLIPIILENEPKLATLWRDAHIVNGRSFFDLQGLLRTLYKTNYPIFTVAHAATNEVLRLSKPPSLPKSQHFSYKLMGSIGGGMRIVASNVAALAYTAASVNPAATWHVVNQMLQELCGVKPRKTPARTPQSVSAAAPTPRARTVVTASFGNVDFSKLDFTKLKF